MKAIHQFVAGFSNGDAISNEAAVMRGIFRSWGYESRIYSEPRRILPELRKEAHDINRYRQSAGPDDVLLLHLSIGSIVNDIFAELPGRKVILYHNVTPPEYFRGIQEEIAANLARGREQIKALAETAEVVLADSRFNAKELESMGYGKVSVLPLVLDLDRVRDRPSRRVTREYCDGLINILFVGRCVPNKRIEDALCAFHYFQRYVEPGSRFIHVGSYAGMEQYHAYLLTQARELQLENVVFTGSVRQDELNAFYRSAHVFLCMSEHEGFCIPVIESMALDVPVLAYDAAAIPETMNGAGVLFSEKRFDLISEMMGNLSRTCDLRKSVLEGQSERIARYEDRDPSEELRELLSPLLA